MKEIDVGFKDNHTVTLYGPHGIGKTDLALRYLKEYYCGPKSFWAYLPCSDPVTLDASLKKYFDSFYPHNASLEIGKKTALDYRRSFLNELENSKHYFVIVDDVHDEEIWEFIRSFPPKGPLGKLLITTLQPKLDAGYMIKVDGITDQQAIQFYKNKIPLSISDRSESTDISSLNRFCGGNLSALKLSTSYIFSTGTDIDSYLSSLNSGKALPYLENISIDKNIIQILDLSFNQLERRAEANDSAASTAIEILKYCSFLHYKSIDIDLLCTLIHKDQTELDQGMSELLSFSLLERKDSKVELAQYIQILIFFYYNDATTRDFEKNAMNHFYKEATKLLMTPYNILNSSFITHFTYMLQKGIDPERLLHWDKCVVLYEATGERYLKYGNMQKASKFLGDAKLLYEKNTSANVPSFTIADSASKEYSYACILLSLAYLYEARGEFKRALSIINSHNFSVFNASSKECFLRFLQLNFIKSYLYEDIGYLKRAARISRYIDIQLSSVKNLFSNYEFSEIQMELYNLQGNLSLATSDYVDAICKYNLAINIMNSISLKEDCIFPAYVWACGNQALAQMLWFNSKQNWSEEAINIDILLSTTDKLLNQIYEKSFNLDVAYQKFRYGYFCFINKKYDQSFAYLKDSIRILDDLNLASHPLNIECYLIQVFICIELCDYINALQLCQIGLEHIKAMDRNPIRTRFNYVFNFLKLRTQVYLQSYSSRKVLLKQIVKVLVLFISSRISFRLDIYPN